MSNERSAQNSPNTHKLSLLEKAEIGFIAVGGFFGIFHPGAVEQVGAAVGEPMDKGAHDAITTTTAVLKGAAQGVVEVAGDNTPPADPARDHLNHGVEREHGTSGIH